MLHNLWKEPSKLWTDASSFMDDGFIIYGRWLNNLRTDASNLWTDASNLWTDASNLWTDASNLRTEPS